MASRNLHPNGNLISNEADADIPSTNKRKAKVAGLKSTPKRSRWNRIPDSSDEDADGLLSDDNTPEPVSSPKKRSKKRVKTASRHNEGDLFSNDDSTSEAGPPPKKRAKKRAKTAALRTGGDFTDVVQVGATKRRKTRGTLQQITDTPLDVLFEIFSYLEPLDLLRLSRTSKDLRQLLMSKSTAFVWERARLGVEDLPPKFDNMNEVQFANLLFDSHCHTCGKANVKNVQWEIQMRLCSNCLHSESTDILTRRHYIPDCPYRHALLELTPMCLSGNHGVHTMSLYHTRTFQALCDESRALADFSAFQVWRETKTKERHAFLERRNIFIEWESARREGRSAQLSNLRKERFQSILAKLREDGWTPELKEQKVLMMLRAHKCVNQPKALTEKMWSNMRATLTEAMSEMRQMFNAEKKRTAVQRRTDILIRLCTPILDALPELPVNPLASQIPHLEPFISIITRTPLLDDITQDHFTKGLETLPDIIKTWRHSIETHLKTLLRAAGHSDDLTLAHSLFTCRSCRTISLSYPEIAHHSCFDQGDWSHNRDVVSATDQVGRDMIDRLVDLAGLDSARATMKDIDESDALFSCGTCYDAQSRTPPKSNPLDKKYLYAMPLHHAIKHITASLSRKHNGAASLMRITDPSHITHIQAERYNDIQSKMAYSSQSFACRHCDIVVQNVRWANSWQDHLRTKHDIQVQQYRNYDHYRPSLASRSEYYRACVDGMQFIQLKALYEVNAAHRSGQVEEELLLQMYSLRMAGTGKLETIPKRKVGRIHYL